MKQLLAVVLTLIISVCFKLEETVICLYTNGNYSVEGK